MRDEEIPGTLNVGHTLPTVTEAFIYVALVQVDVTTLVSMIRGRPRWAPGWVRAS
ncbi:MAG: hypothetical protein WDO73_31315 [Ignavibacteriota bacterium]